MADLAGFATDIVQSALDMPGHFADVAAHDPLNYVFIAIGVLFVAAPMAALTYLTLGAFLELFTVDSSPPPQH